jgi:hypothetical protein
MKERRPPRSPKERAISKFELIIRIPLYVRRLVRRNEAGFIARGCRRNHQGADMLRIITVDAKTIYTFCGNYGLTLDYGQNIPFENMQGFAMLDEKLTIQIVPLDGEHLTGRIDPGCGIHAINEFGPFDTLILNTERVDFGH